MEKYETISFIPARGGSKRVPGKNIKILAGKPMIAWTIEASLESRYIDRTFVSTEDKEIKRIALKYGAEVINRPPELSQGEINFTFAYEHFKYCLWKEKYEPDYAIILFPTMPLRTVKHIDEAFELYFKSKEKYPLLASFTKAPLWPMNTFTINESGEVKYLLEENTRRKVCKRFMLHYTGRQSTYYDESAIRIGPFTEVNYFNIDAMIAGFDLTQPYIMSAEDSIDVDTPLDFKVAEMLFKERLEFEKKGGGIDFKR